MISGDEWQLNIVKIAYCTGESLKGESGADLIEFICKAEREYKQLVAIAEYGTSLDELGLIDDEDDSLLYKFRKALEAWRTPKDQ